MSANARFPCTTCKTSGEILAGWTQGSWHHPPEGVTAECPVCKGEGEVSEEVLENWGGVLPEEDEAAEIIVARMTEPEYDAEKDL